MERKSRKYLVEELKVRNIMKLAKNLKAKKSKIMFKISKIKQKLLILRKVIQATEVVPKELLKEEIFVKYFRKLFKLIMQKIVLIPKKLNAKLSK